MQKLINIVRKHLAIIIFFLVIFFIYQINGMHEAFPDEYDNIVGGWYITRGILPYTGFFSHHNPGAYFISALIVLVTKQSFVAFRIVWSLLLFASIIFITIITQKKIGKSASAFMYLFITLLGLGSTYFWGEMMLSETIVAYCLIIPYVFILHKFTKKIKLTIFDFVLISACTYIALMTSFTFIFSVGILFLLTIAAYLKDYKFLSKETLKVLGIFITPYLLFIAYLLVTGGLERFYFSSIFYNREYYIYNFPVVAGKISKHPIRYVISIFYNTSWQFYLLLKQVRDFNFGYPVNITLVVGNAAFLIYLISKKHYFLSFLLYNFLVFLNARSEPLNSKETDFHSTVYIVISFINLSYVLFHLIDSINHKIQSEVTRYVYIVLWGIVSIYSIFLTGSFLEMFSQRAYAKFMGQMPGIYDNPVVAPLINKLVSKDEYFWIGPFEFQELLYIQGKLPSKYHWFLPANEKSPRIRTELISDLTKNRPKLIVFKDNLSYFGTIPIDYNYPIVDFLDANYFRIKDLSEQGMKIKINYLDLHNFDIYWNFYFDKNRKDEIIAQLIKTGIVHME